jgi:hypothetical protein
VGCSGARHGCTWVTSEEKRGCTRGLIVYESQICEKVLKKVLLS